MDIGLNTTLKNQIEAGMAPKPVQNVFGDAGRDNNFM